VAVLLSGVWRDAARLENSFLVVAASARALSATGPLAMDWTAWEFWMEFMVLAAAVMGVRNWKDVLD
jgi:hypothetical protein